MKTKNILAALTLLAASLCPTMAQAQSDEAKMNSFIDNLMNKMTLKEKLGQLNLPVTGDIVTGQAKSSDVASKIKRGEVDPETAERIVGRLNMDELLGDSVLTMQEIASGAPAD